ncbi:MAG: PIN domain-containing protein [Actinomycetota bacterium]|nr:PIN domain-containing protein [Actinomycetota bacterium]
MTTYVDTSALYAVIVADDPDHERAATALRALRAGDERLLTTSYVLVEAAALLQSRIGLPAVRTLHERLRPVLDLFWVDADLHDEAMSALLAADTRGLSLVDWVGFTLMRRRGLARAFAFDDDFASEGFVAVP